MKKGWDAADALRENVPEQYLAALIEGAMEYGKTVEELETKRPQEATAPAIDLSRWTADAYVGLPPERQWLIRDVAARGVLMMLASMGGLGKSYLALKLAYDVATGDLLGNSKKAPESVLGKPVESHGTVVFITAEDDKAEVHRRLNVIDPTERRLLRPDRLRIVPLPDVGTTLNIIENDFNRPKVGKDYSALLAQLLEIEDLALVVFDPLQAFVGGDANQDPAVGQFLCILLGRLARETGATVILTHHFRKQSGIEAPSAAREAIRGTTALVDGMRCAYALWYPSEKRARAICAELGIPYEENKVALGAVVKANYAADFCVHVYVRGENGLLRNRSDLGSLPGQRAERDRLSLLETLSIAVSTERPFTKSGNSGVWERRSELSSTLQSFGRKRLQGIVQDLLDDGRLIQQATKSDSRAIWLIPSPASASASVDDGDREEPPF